MKGVIAAATLAALTTTVNAYHIRRGHEAVAKRNAATTDCSTDQTTLWASTHTRVPPIPHTPHVEYTTGAVTVPTPIAYTFPTPGTYTLPASSVTVTDPTTVCGATSTQLPAGTHTIGGVTTVVDKPTTVTLPVATVTTIDNVPTSTVVQATFTCPSAGTYTFNPITTTLTEPTVVFYPTTTAFHPGTYTAPSQVLTVTEPNSVTYCPFSSAGLAAPEPTAASISPEDAPKPMDDQATTSKAAVIKSRSAMISSNNDHLGITYTPYDSNTGGCKSAWQVDQDIAKFHSAGFQVVRVYSTDCGTLQSVGDACAKYGMKMIIGVFIGGPGCSYNSPNIKAQVDAIAAWGKWNLVQLFVVGNEAIVNGYCSGAQLRDLITTVKSKCPSYHGPFTVSETLNVWQRGDVSGAICPVVDMAGANIHAYFTPSVKAEFAGNFVGNQLSFLDKICPGKPGMILESGWPTKGVCNGVACPGEGQQSQAIQSIRRVTGSRTIFFSPDNDQWKAEGSCGCEKSWGTKQLFGL